MWVWCDGVCVVTWYLHIDSTYERFMRIFSREMVEGTWMLSLGASAGGIVDDVVGWFVCGVGMWM